MASKAFGAGDMETTEVPLDFEEDLAKASSNTPDSKFDITIGHIEDIIMEEEFQQLQQDFMDKYYAEFEDTEENKFVYTEIHKEYIDLIEKYLLVNLSERIEDFSMEEFQKELVSRKEELHGEVFEMLLTFSDFVAFKELFIDYRNEKEGKVVDLSQGLVVRSLSQNASKLPDSLPQNGSQLPAVSCQSFANPSAAEPAVHNLEIGGQSFLISTPGGSGLDLTPTPVQINRVNGDCGKAGNLQTNCEDVESMNISPRPEQMDE